MSSCVIARPINGISLNGLEFVLDEFGEVKQFENKDEAFNYLKQNGVTEREIQHLEIIENY